MRPSVVLLLSGDTERRAHWSALVRQAGHWPLAAATLAQALAYLRKVRPTLVLTEAQVGDGRGLGVLDEMQAVAPLQSVPVIVVGPLTPTEALMNDPTVYVWPAPHDGGALLHLVEEVLA